MEHTELAYRQYQEFLPRAVLEEAKITPRQIEICELRFVKGMTNYQIAAQLNISDKTVEKELNTAYKQISNVLASL